MGKRRQERMAVEIKKILSAIFQQDIKDPRIDFSTVSVTRVDITADLSHARINISVLGDEAHQQETIQAIQKARGYIRTELAKQLQTRYAPELELRLDKSIEHGIHISSLLDELNKEAEAKKEKTNE